MSQKGFLRLSGGFGEIALLWSKLNQADVEWEAELNVDDIRGSEQLVPLLPGIKEVRLGSHNTYHVLANAIPPTAKLEAYLPGPIYPTVDHFLLRGNNLVDWLPDLPIDWHYPVNLHQSTIDNAKRLTNNKPYLLVYPSSRQRLQYFGEWGNVWNEKQWADLCVRLERGLSIPLYVVGAPRDNDMIDCLVRAGAVDPNNVIISERLGQTLALIKNASYMVGFPAGPTVMAGIFGVPHCMLFRSVIQRKMRGAFTDPEMLDKGTAYLPVFSNSPGYVADVILDTRLSEDHTREHDAIPYVVEGNKELPDINVIDNLGQAAQKYDPNKVFGVKHHRDDPSHTWFYALGYLLKPKYILDLGKPTNSDLHALIRGTLDNGGPIRRVAGTFANTYKRNLEGIKELCTRSSAELTLNFIEDSVANDKLRYTGNYFGYDVVHVRAGNQYFLEDLQFGYEMLGVPGTLVVSGISDDVITACKVFSEKKKIQPTVLCGIPGWVILRK